MTATRHFLVWIPAKDPRHAMPPDGNTPAARAFHPVHHTTGQRHLRNRVRQGDVLWFVRQLKRLHLPPSFDGFLTVEQTFDGVPLTFTAGTSSRWLPWRDATNELLSLHPGGKALRQDTMAQHLRSSREITCPEESERITAFARQTLTRPTAFISYSWRDGRSWLPLVVRRLEELSYTAWFDLWSGPRRIANGVEQAPEGQLREMLRQAIAQAICFIELHSPTYGESHWVQCERAMAYELDKPVLRLTLADLSRFSL